MIEIKDKLLLYCIYLIVPIDLITGYYLIQDNEANPLLGKLFKFFIYLIIFVQFYKLNKIAQISFILIFMEVLYYGIDGNLRDVPVNLINGSKVVLFNLFFYQLFYLNKISLLYIDIVRIFKFSSIIIVANQAFGVSGYGKSTYNFEQLGLGTSGYYFETNSYGFLMLIIEAIGLQWLLNKFGLLIFLLGASSFMVLGLSVATKLTIAGSVLVPLIILFVQNKKYFLIFGGILALTVMIYISELKDANSIQKIISSFNEKGIGESIFSGRDVRFLDSINVFVDRYTIAEKLMGIGYFRVINDPNLSGTAEMDMIDILKLTGFLGFIFIYGSFFVITYRLMKNYRMTKLIEFKTVCYLNIFFLLVSALSGHFFTAGTPGVFLAILNIYPYAVKGK